MTPAGAGPQIVRFLKHSTVYAVGNVMNRAGALLLLPLYTNYLTTAQYGALELFYVVSAIVSGLLSVGIAHATLRFYFEYDAERDRRAVVSSNLFASFAIAVAGAWIVGLFRVPLAEMVFGTPGYATGVVIILATMVLELSSQVCLAYLRAREYSVLFVSIAFGKLVVQCGANAYLVAILAAGVQGVLLGNLLAVAAGWLVLVVFTVRRCGLRFELAKTLPSLRYSFPFVLSAIVAWISGSIDRILINKFLTLQALGVFALAAKFASLIDHLIGESFNRSYGAFRFSIMKSADAGDVHVRLVRYLFVVTLCTGLLIALFASDVLRVMAKPEFWPAAEVLPLLVLASTLQVLCYPLNTGILYAKRTGYFFYIGLASAATSAGANLLLIPLLGLQGAALAHVTVAILSVVLNDRISQRFFAVRYEWRRMGTAALLAVIAYLVARPFDDASLAASLLGKGMVYGGFLVSLAVLGVLTRAEMDWLRGRLVALRGA